MAAEPDPREATRRAPLGLRPAGLVVGTAWALLAMTPSLVPRNWLFQGVVSGISAAVGYGVGVALVWLAARSQRWRQLAEWVRCRVPPFARRAVQVTLLVAAPVAVLAMLVVAARWQREISVLTGMDRPATSGWLRTAPVLFAVAALLLYAARGVRALARLVARVLRRWLRLPRQTATVLGAVVVGLLVAVAVDDVLLRRALSVADASFSGLDAETYPGVQQPQRPTRSGSPASLVPWETLGREGRALRRRRPSTRGVGSRQRRATPVDPIRVYVGARVGARARRSAPTLPSPSSSAPARSTAPWSPSSPRRAPAGSTPATADSLELMYGGDTAVVATQYSYLPSWLSFLVDRSRAEDEGRPLFDAVHARIDADARRTPRPRLLVFGESLGSQGSEAAFTTLADIRAQADGVLWVGPPNSNRLWRALVERRDPGTPEVAAGVRRRPRGALRRRLRRSRAPAHALDTRRGSLYLQHASDPVVWWSPDLLLARPDWLVEPRGDDVSPAMGWYPVVTFWQVTIDLTNSRRCPRRARAQLQRRDPRRMGRGRGTPRLDRGGHRPGSSGAQRLTARSTRAPVTARPRGSGHGGRPGRPGHPAGRATSAGGDRRAAWLG